MKNIYKILIAFIGVLAVSCNADDVDNRPIVEALSIPEITAPATGKAFILDVNKDTPITNSIRIYKRIVLDATFLIFGIDLTILSSTC